MIFKANLACCGAASMLLALSIAPALAADPDASGSNSDFFSDWFARVDRIQSEQPHWITPIATVTPRLEEEVRYDQYFETLPTHDAHLNNFDAGKGLELIPWDNVEVLLNVPPYEERGFESAKTPAVNGWGDWPFMTVKYRLLSANEQNGNYIVTAYLGASAPTGADAFTSHQYVVTPTLGFGKGWGDFDIQGTIAEAIPMGSVPKSTVQQTISNTTFQYHFGTYFWPELEVNYTWWPDGPKEGKNQVYLTPGLVFGRIPLFDRTKLIVGAGYQIATSPTTPVYRNNAILTVRVAF